MKFKKILTGLLSVAMVTATMAMPVLADGEAPKLDISNPQDGVVEVTGGTYKLPPINENITIKAAEGAEVVFDCVGTGSICSIPNGATFEGVTFKMGTSSYHGFQHAGHIKMNKCTINGLFFSYGDMTFTDCTFNAPGAKASGFEGTDYSMWCYGKDMVYTDCIFNFKGKCLNIYNEGNGGWEISATGCTFNNEGAANKSAFNMKDNCIKSDGTLTALEYALSISDCRYNGNAPDIIDSKNNADGTKLFVFDPLVQLDDIGDTPNPNIKITLNGKTLWENGEKVKDEVTNVAEVGGVQYESVKAAVEAAESGDTIKLLTDVTAEETSSGMVTFLGKEGDFTFDCNGHTLKGGIEDSYSSLANITVIGNDAVDTEYIKKDNGQMIQFAALFNNKGDMVVEKGTFSSTNVVVLQYDGTVELNDGFYVIGAEDHPVVASEGGTTTINGGTYTGTDNLSIFCSICAVDNGVVNVYDGTFEGYLEEVNGGQINLYGGTYYADPSAFVAEGYVAVENGNLWTVQEEVTNVAEVDGVQYKSLEEAVAAAKTGDTVKLLADAEGNGIKILKGTKNITIDLNNYTYTMNGKTVGSATTETQCFHLEKGNTITIQNGTIDTVTAANAKMLIQNYSDLTLNNVILDGTNLTGNKYTLSNNNGNIVLTGNTQIIAAEDGVAYDLYDWSKFYSGITLTIGDNVTINGKTEVGGDNKPNFNITVTASDKAKLPTAPDGFVWKANGNVYTLAEAVPEIVIDDTTGEEAEITNNGEKASKDDRDKIIAIVTGNKVVNEFGDTGIKEAVENGKDAVIAELKKAAEAASIDVEKIGEAPEIKSNVRINLVKAEVAKDGEKVYSNKMTFDVCPIVTTTVEGEEVTAEIHNPAEPITFILPVASYIAAGKPAKVTHKPENEEEEIINTIVKAKGEDKYIEVTLNSFSEVLYEIQENLDWQYEKDCGKYVGEEGEKGVVRFLYDTGLKDSLVKKSGVLFFGKDVSGEDKETLDSAWKVVKSGAYGAFSADLFNINLTDEGKDVYSIGYIVVNDGTRDITIWSDVQSYSLRFDRLVDYQEPSVQ